MAKPTTSRDELPVLLTVEQAAAVLQMHPESVRTQIRAGRLPARKYGRSWRILRDELLAPTRPVEAEFGHSMAPEGRLSRPGTTRETYITQGEAAAMLDCSRATIGRMISRGDLPSVASGPNGGARRVDRDALLELVARRMSR